MVNIVVWLYLVVMCGEIPSQLQGVLLQSLRAPRIISVNKELKKLVLSFLRKPQFICS
jgi:hypothetical protein